MSDLTEAELEHLERLLAEAQPGPWKSFVEGRDHESGSDFIMTGLGQARGEDLELPGATVADRDLIAEARNALPRLIAEVRRRRKMPC